jgi:hypothetical protein
MALVTTGEDDTWRRDVPMAFLPRPGDEIALWPDEDGDPSGGVMWPVEAPRWDSAGVAWIELVPMRVDPDDDALESLRVMGPRSEKPWWTATDGTDIEARLTRGGWVRR